MRTISLTRRFYPATSLSTDSRMTVVAVGSEMPSEVFILQRINLGDDRFVAVASPTTIEDYPTTAPEDDSSYFRTDTVELVASNQEALESIYNIMVDELQLLISNLNAMDVVASTMTVTLNGTTIT